MFRRVMMALVAAFVMVMAFGALPLLTLASPATVSPPELFVLAPEAPQAQPGNRMLYLLIEARARARPTSLLYASTRAKVKPATILLL